MKMTENRKAMITRHVKEIEQAVGTHRSHLAAMVERQRLELIELMLVEDVREKPRDVIALIRAELEQWKRNGIPSSVEYEDAAWLLRALNSFEADKFPAKEAE